MQTTGHHHKVGEIKDCIQRQNHASSETFTREHIGSEDCLFLNVYSRAKSTKDKLPVVVWVHGGGFLYGSGCDREYGPNYAMNEDIVLVTLNYRLGVFGFLATDDGVLPGNLGLKDQLLALKWIKDNISSFGGDSNNITLAGESAGAVCVHHLMLSELAKGLFHKAILQSGSSLGWWGYKENPNEITKRFAQTLNCPETMLNDTSALKQFFMDTDDDKLLEATLKLNDPFQFMVRVQFFALTGKGGGETL
jgi:carboxylesterase type B